MKIVYTRNKLKQLDPPSILIVKKLKNKNSLGLQVCESVEIL